LPCAPEVRGHAHAVGEITPLCLRALRLSRLTYQALSQFGRLRRSTNGFGRSSWGSHHPLRSFSRKESGRTYCAAIVPSPRHMSGMATL
jgi:hypothetical protein